MKIGVLTIAILMFSTSLVADENVILGYFQKENPDITEVHIIEYVSNYYHEGGLLVARGIKPTNSFTGNWNDELFGVFHTDKNMEIINALEFIPTKRWHDYCAEVKRKEFSHFVVRFYGCTYSDVEIVREYNVD